MEAVSFKDMLASPEWLCLMEVGEQLSQTVIGHWNMDWGFD